MDKRKILACVGAAQMLSMMAMVIAFRKRKCDRTRVGISYGPIAEKDRINDFSSMCNLRLDNYLCV
jgi:hypothetical protein